MRTPSSYLRRICGSVIRIIAAACVLFVYSCGTYATAVDYSGIVSGNTDTHCYNATVVNPTACPTPVAGAFGGDTLYPNADANTYRAPMYNNAGTDDACKYHLGWSAKNVRANTPVTITLDVAAISTLSAVTGAAPSLDVFLGADHHTNSPNQTATMGNPGTYTIGPVVFDQAGLWTMRAHVFDTCADTVTDSQNGHAAFWINVEE